MELWNLSLYSWISGLKKALLVQHLCSASVINPFFLFPQEKLLKFRIFLRNHGEIVAIKGYSGVCVCVGGCRGTRGGGWGGRWCFENSCPSVPGSDWNLPWLTSGISGCWSSGNERGWSFEPRDNLAPQIVIMLLRMFGVGDRGVWAVGDWGGWGGWCWLAHERASPLLSAEPPSDLACDGKLKSFCSQCIQATTLECQRTVDCHIFLCALRAAKLRRWI